MKRRLMRIAAVLFIAALLFGAYAYYQLRSRGFLRAPVYESVAPDIPALSRPAVLVFSKTNSYIHAEAIPAAKVLFEEMAARKGWSIYFTENGAVHNPNDLARFDTIIWNNVTGDVLTKEQQQAFIAYLEQGGGWLGIHGAGDGSSSWRWYNEALIGARFIGHPMEPQFQEALIQIEQPADPIVAHIGGEWRRQDEWYSFDRSPRRPGVTILATLDETSYSPRYFDKDISMGTDHPIVWKQCPGRGRAVYSAMGHTAESFAEPKHIEMLERAITWSAGLEGDHCDRPALAAENLKTSQQESTGSDDG
jgi:type 1 glutamine amidotransferase